MMSTRSGFPARVLTFPVRKAQCTRSHSYPAESNRRNLNSKNTGMGRNQNHRQRRPVRNRNLSSRTYDEFVNAQIEWINRVTNYAPRANVADAISLARSTYNRQYAKGSLDPQYLIAIARKYGANPMEGLVAGGYLTPEEVYAVNEKHYLGMIPNDDLMAELYRRMQSSRAKD